MKFKAWYHSRTLPEWQKSQVEILKRELPSSKDQLWMLSSGTQSVRSTKALALSHEGIFASCKSVNKHLEASKSDRWAKAIPDYFIGGLSIFPRAELSGSKVFEFHERWNAEKFTSFCSKNKITLTSLVPTQVYDLVHAKRTSPPSLRAAIIGGGALSPELYQAARALGWPILISYGLTETSSQVATASLKSLESEEYPKMEILSHAALEMKEHLEIRASSLAKFTAILRAEGSRTLEVTAPNGIFRTADLGEVSGKFLKIFGRADDVVKIKGVLVPVPEIEHELARILQAPLCVIAVPDPRTENRLLLILEEESDVTKLLKLYNAKVPSPRRLHHTLIRKIPRGEMGKVKKAELKRLLGF